MERRSGSGERRSARPPNLEAPEQRQVSESSGTRLDNYAKQVVTLRKRPLLVLYYHEYDGKIREDDVEDIHDEFRERGVSATKRLAKLDVLIHGYGGEPDASYRIAQVIRNFADHVEFLVPFHATSGATLISLCANKIHLGPYAFLSPVDIRMGEVELVSIESFRKFATDARRDIERMLADVKSTRTSDVESVLLRELVKQETALNIGALYRISNLTGHYSFRLMYDYMFRSDSNREALCQAIANQLLHDLPSHDFTIDFHMGTTYCNLPLSEMDENTFDRTRQFVEALGELSEQGVICKDVWVTQRNETVKAPFFRLYVR